MYNVYCTYFAFTHFASSKKLLSFLITKLFSNSVCCGCRKWYLQFFHKIYKFCMDIERVVVRTDLCWFNLHLCSCLKYNFNNILIWKNIAIYLWMCAGKHFYSYRYTIKYTYHTYILVGIALPYHKRVVPQF